MLDFEKINGGQVVLKAVSTNIKKLIETTCTRASILMQSKKQELITHVSDEVPEVMLLDEIRYTQLVSNLISNAFKYTPTGGTIELRFDIRREYTLDEKTYLRFSVKDNGPGISEEKLRDIFKPYVQGTYESERMGSGLGLAIAKEIVELCRGSISVTSTLGEGSTFSVEIPIEMEVSVPSSSPMSMDTMVGPSCPTVHITINEAEDFENAPLLKRSSSYNAFLLRNEIMEKSISKQNTQVEEPPCVLVVDDAPINRQILVKMLGKVLPDWTIHEACDGLESVEKARQVKFSLIFMDLVMPNLDGYGASERIREMDPTSKIVICSANNVLDESGRDLGMFTDILNKPFTLAMLRSLLTKHGFIKQD